MLTILLEAWIAHRRGLAAYDTADTLTSLHLGMVSQVVGLFVKLAMLGIYTAVYEHWRFVSLPANSVWVWLGALLAYDFCYYWTHRLGHEVGVMWAAHVVHHSSEFYNLSTALRQTSSGWVLGWLFYLPMALAGVPPPNWLSVSSVPVVTILVVMVIAVVWLDKNIKTFQWRTT